MNNSDSILSILNAIEQIHLKPKKKTLDLSSTKNTIAKLNHNSKIPSDISKLISEAEDYKRKHFKALETI